MPIVARLARRRVALRYSLASLLVITTVMAVCSRWLSEHLRSRDHSILSGEWYIVYYEIDGSRFEPRGVSSVSFDGNRASYDLYGVAFSYRVMLDGTHYPKHIDITRCRSPRDGHPESHGGDIGRGIYRHSTDRNSGHETLILCLSDDRRPTEFATCPDSPDILVALRRRL